MKTPKAGLMVWILAFAPLVMAVIVYPFLPEQIVRQWQLDEIAYWHKANVFLTAGASPVLAVVMLAVPKIDPKRKNYARFSGQYRAVLVAVLLFLLGANVLVVVEAFYPGAMSPETIIPCAVGLLMAFLGNLMPKFKSNFFAGVRTPWTLSDSDVWFKANRLGGQLFFFGGLLIAVGIPFIPDMRARVIALMAVVLVIALVPVVMSYVWYRRRHGSE